MKRLLARVGVLFLTMMLISCGGGSGSDSPSGGDSSSGAGSPAPSNAPAPATPIAGTPPAANGSTPPPTTPEPPPPTTAGGTRPPTTGEAPLPTAGGTPPPATGETPPPIAVVTPPPATGETPPPTAVVTPPLVAGGTPPPTDGGTPPPAAGGTPPPPPTFARVLVEESDTTAVNLIGTWTKSDPKFGWSGGTAKQSNEVGAIATFKFSGTAVRWIGTRNTRSGIALVRVDGAEAKEVDLFSRPNKMRVAVMTLYGLPPGEHMLTVEVTGRQNTNAVGNAVVVDAFEAEPEILSHLQETDPDVKYSGTGWLQADSKNWSGGGVFSGDDPTFGGARFSSTAGDKITLTFRGTSIAWSGYRGPDAGIARVTLDDEVSDVDTYAPVPRFQEVVFTKAGLDDASHTLTVEVTGARNAASTSPQIFLDAFDVTTPGRRYEEVDRENIAYSDGWVFNNRNRTWSEGSAVKTNIPGSRATFKFTGTSVSWIGCQKSSAGGKAKVYIDDVEKKQVNNKQPEPIEGYQHTIYRIGGLTDGPHTLTIEALPSGGSWLVIDAFDVHPQERAAR